METEQGGSSLSFRFFVEAFDQSIETLGPVAQQSGP
jgi:hypothetical protein